MTIPNRRAAGAHYPALILLGYTICACSGSAAEDRRPYRFGYGMIDTPDPLGSQTGKGGHRAHRSHSRHSRSRRSWRDAVVKRALQLAGLSLAEGKAAASQQLLRQALGHDPGPAAELCRRSRPKNPQRADIVCFGTGADRRIGIVVEASRGEVAFIYLNGSRIRRGVLNNNWPHQRRIAGRIVNSYLKVKHPDDRPQTAYLAAELLAGYVETGSDR